MIKTCQTNKISVCDIGWSSFLIGDEISCLKNVGLLKLDDTSSYCQSINASQVLPRSKQESDDLVQALLSLDLVSENGETLVSLGIYRTRIGEWFDSTGQLISYFNWLPYRPADLSGNSNCAALRINEVNGISGWDEFSGTDKLNAVCTKTAGYGKNNSLF